MTDAPLETWTVTKPARHGPRGVVAAQEIEAAEAGAAILRDGGNAIDAAVATALALAVTEPWMSGLGGIGFAIVHSAAEGAVRAVDFGPVAPAALDPADYRLTGEEGADMFGWPRVEGDANIHGARSIAVPGAVAGYALAAERFGRKPWAELAAPAVALAERGHRATWWTTLNVAAEAPLLALYPASREAWLPGGFPPSMPAEGPPERLPNPALARTLETLAREGPRAFYEGALARSIAADVRAAGGPLSEADLAGYAARVVEPLSVARGDAVYHLPAGLTAGPTFADALSRLPAFGPGAPDDEVYAAYAAALAGAYRRRLETMGHAGDDGGRACTTHISTADADGNMVLMTTTLLSRFGSRLVLPGSGVPMNNGINWFDPRPGRPNALAPGARPLTNMCPMAATRDGAPRFGLGASGGRRIVPAVFQLASFANDFGMDLGAALARPRIDASGIDRLVHDGRLDAATVAAIRAVAPSEPWTPTAFPTVYANPSGVAMADGGGCVGAAHIHSPAGGVAVA